MAELARLAAESVTREDLAAVQAELKSTQDELASASG